MFLFILDHSHNDSEDHRDLREDRERKPTENSYREKEKKEEIRHREKKTE